jgi:hypothetical protein
MVEDWVAGPKVEDYDDIKDYEIAHLKWQLMLAQQIAADRFAEVQRLREELYG